MFSFQNARQGAVNAQMTEFLALSAGMLRAKLTSELGATAADMVMNVVQPVEFVGLGGLASATLVVQVPLGSAPFLRISRRPISVTPVRYADEYEHGMQPLTWEDFATALDA